MRLHSFAPLLAVASVAILSHSASARADDSKALEAGFRPYSEHASSFVDGATEATIAVHPTLLRGAVETTYSVASQKEIIAWLDQKNMGNALEGSIRVDLGRPEARSQWELFLEDMQRISWALWRQPPDADYHIFLEILFPRSQREVFAIHCYVLDRQRQNAFSFLLNTHHELFSDARLTTKRMSEGAHANLVKKATDVALSALEAQVANERKSPRKAEGSRAAKAKPGVLDDFESGLPSGKDRHGIDLGFSTAADRNSSAKISTQAPPTAVPGKGASNEALKIEFDVTEWGAFIHSFENDAVDRWISYDWSDFNQFSFWLYGRNSGNLLFVHILDNRKPSSTVEDAERNGYEFTDDFFGWKKVTIRFADMERKEVGNGAPVDGLGLSEVHGWALGTLKTKGPVTYYLDDFELQNVPSHGAELQINELPMYGHLQKTAAQQLNDKRYIERMTKDGRSREAAAEYVARVGWNAYNTGDHALAIKRFNQAWLLDRENQFALWGFAAISMKRGYVEEAVRYYQMAIESGPENANLIKDYQDARRRLEQQP